MKVKRKTTGTASSIPVGLALGVFVSLLATFAGSALTAWMINNEMIGEESVGYAAIFILVIAAILGALVSVWRIKRLRLQMCMLTGALYFLSLLAITALFFGGQYQGVGTSAIAIVAGCTVVAFIPGRNRQSIPKRKKAFC